MKRNSYALIAAGLLLLSGNDLNAQSWRGKHNGLESGISANIVYGEGTNILVGNSAMFSGHPMYYTPDSSTLFNYTSSSLGAVAAIESQVVKCMGHLFVGSSAGIYKSNDMGHTWSIAGTSVTDNLAAYSMYSLNDTLYAGNTLGAYFSTDTGLTWTAIPGYTGSMPVSFLRTGNILFVGGTSTLQYTTDWGTTWQNVTSPSSIVSASVPGLAKLGSNVYAATNNGIYQTTDNGHTWTRVIAKVFSCIKTVDTSILAGTATNGLYQSDHSGTTWTAINTGLPYTGVATYNEINSISCNDNFIMCLASGDSVMYVIGYSDLGLHATPTTTQVTKMEQQQPEVSIFPNPAMNLLTISTLNIQNEKMTINMYDITGRVMKTFACDAASRTNLDVSYLPEGVYYVQMHAGSFSSVKKIVIAR